MHYNQNMCELTSEHIALEKRSIEVADVNTECAQGGDKAEPHLKSRVLHTACTVSTMPVTMPCVECAVCAMQVMRSFAATVENERAHRSHMTQAYTDDVLLNKLIQVQIHFHNTICREWLPIGSCSLISEYRRMHSAAHALWLHTRTLLPAIRELLRQLLQRECDVIIYCQRTSFSPLHLLDSTVASVVAAVVCPYMHVFYFLF